MSVNMMAASLRSAPSSPCEQRLDLLYAKRRAQLREEFLCLTQGALARAGVAFEACELGAVEQDERSQARRAGLVAEPPRLAQGGADGGRYPCTLLGEEHVHQRPL